MRVLVVGGGGREHALVWKLSQSPEVEKIFCAPGNAGIASLAECIPIKAEEIEKLQNFAREKDVHLTVVGPEAPLAAGITDLFRENGQLIFGPCREGAFLEGSKVWAKQFMAEHGIPTAQFEIFQNPGEAYRYLKNASYPLVVKADGLAAGKGVIVAESFREASQAVCYIMEEKAFGGAGDSIVIEEFLRGEEVSVFAITDGHTFYPLPPVQDHKAVYEGDRGPNTGGMGAYSPAPVLTKQLSEKVNKEVFEPLLRGFQKEGITYRGVIFGGLMITTGSDLRVLEFNVRFGDPEAQVLLPRLQSDLSPLLYEAARGNLRAVAPPEWSTHTAVCVVLASRGYPGDYEKGKEIRGLEKVPEFKNAAVFHAGTAFKDNKTVTAGGRVLGLTAWDPSLKLARHKAYSMAEVIDFEGKYYRRDIGYRALERS
ncbi:MAG: phosphoribosylamine--glycine ligase [Dethiobacter sp.]|jgi:phosphoribosylamine--glycine ligase|nr:MAG: phosphoribosylamine--glycine ligase [Dethiobacter sp.]